MKLCGTPHAAGLVLEKPADSEEARAMLSLLSGTRHLVHTGVALALPPPSAAAGSAARAAAGAAAGTEGQAPLTPILRSFSVTTAVQFAPLSPASIDAYIESGAPNQKHNWSVGQVLSHRPLPGRPPYLSRRPLPPLPGKPYLAKHPHFLHWASPTAATARCHARRPRAPHTPPPHPHPLPAPAPPPLQGSPLARPAAMGSRAELPALWSGWRAATSMS